MEQYCRRNNLEITGVPDNVEEEKLEEKVIEIAQDIEACHRVEKSKNNSKKTIRFINRKYAKKAFLNRKGLRNIDSSPTGLTNSNIILMKP